MPKEEPADFIPPHEGGKKQTIGRLSLMFFMMMIVLTFFSNTLLHFTLPKVEAERPANGVLIKEIFGEGTVEVKQVWEEYAKANLPVKEVLVERGDRVSKGQTILSLDIRSLQDSYLDEQTRCQLLELSLAGAEDALEQKQRDYENIKALVENGAEAEINLLNAEKALAEAARNCDTTRLNLTMQERKVQSLAEQMANGGVYTASADGIITELNFAAGSTVNSTQPLFRLADTGQGFRLVVPVAGELAEYAQPGDTVSVNIYSLDKKTEGKIERITDNSQRPGEQKDVWIDLTGEGLAGGEKGEIYLSKKTKPYPALVPNSAIYTDSEGSFVYVLKSRKGPLGMENYVQRLDVNVEDRDNEKSALTNMIGDEVIIQSNKPLADGDKVLKEAAN
ncbi:efflux RND transporter periplasmic adaptor subunit [Desulfitobacterium chlororespirans]|uniref:RND family efflux transporter, MFP subunit n=1 Tax=Desulfitobacterium chlororespirans DSM 11544 TaxID=1121395 RepID=A0A1M7TVX9_9FIRM|nr:efflux RND transporter periplasmic adaptor subunit [Desulfitobacterium chlororespirans]SHN74899.1 RND family efflux transporter, MFP subunit [Desulfitobacterium chlororespirans DSM 11544]